MAKKDKTINDYIEELKTMVEHRNDGCFDPWLMPMLRATAMNMVILDKMQISLESDNICKLMTGSMGQQKTELHSGYSEGKICGYRICRYIKDFWCNHRYFRFNGAFRNRKSTWSSSKLCCFKGRSCCKSHLLRCECI